MIVELFLIFATFILLFFKYVYWPLRYWREVTFPYLFPYPIVGNCLQVFLGKQSFPEYFLELHRTTKEKLCGINLFSVPIIFIKDLDLIQDVTIKQFDHFVNHSLFLFDLSAFPEVKDSLFNIKDDHWRDVRAKLSTSFTSAKLRQTAPLIEEIYQNLEQYLNRLIDESADRVGQFETKQLMGRLTCDVIVNTSIAVSINSFDDGNNMVYEMISRTAGLRKWKTALNNLFGPKFLKFFNITLLDSESTNFLIDMLKNAYNNRREQNVKRLDTMDILLEAQRISIEKNKLDKSHKVLSDTDLLAQSFVFIVAAYDTVSSMFSFILLELCLNPDVQQKLYDEIMEIYDNGFPLDKLMALKYLNCVILESERKWPPVAIMDRYCNKDFHTNLDGKPVTIKEGSIVMYSIIGNHRDSKIYPNPEKYDPDRFSDENSKDRHPCALLTFGSGPRFCIGMRFALLQMKLTLANLLKDFELVPTSKTLIPIQYDPTRFQGRPYKDWMGVKRRKTNAQLVK